MSGLDEFGVRLRIQRVRFTAETTRFYDTRLPACIVDPNATMHAYRRIHGEEVVTVLPHGIHVDDMLSTANAKFGRRARFIEIHMVKR
ncbi:hypothetical protein SAMN02787142_0597 [Burkholderia sp. WP9]|nr:hypothetical protein SAMN02787142_0597 [Burkholderia sp. WP9]